MKPDEGTAMSGADHRAGVADEQAESRRVTSAQGRVFVRGRPTGFGGSTNERVWKENVRQALGHMSFPTQRLSVSMDFVLGPDQQGHRAPDLDNLIKTTIDALEKVIGARPGNYPGQADDERIDEIVARKRFGGPDEASGVLIEIRPL